MKTKSILLGTVALSMVSTSLISCKKVGNGEQVRDNLSSDQKEVKKHTDGKCGTMKNEDGSEKSVEHKCGEGKCGEGKCGDKKAETTQENSKSTEHKCGEGKCGEGKCG